MFNIEEEFKTLVKNGWLSESEAANYQADTNIISAMNSCTSPQKQNIFHALKRVSYDSIKVLILGKDPYPNPKDAHGLAFSSLDKGTPDSLKNIFKALDSKYNSNLFNDARNDLTHWAEEGVLLLNTGLTFQKISDDSLTTKEKNSVQQSTQRKHMKVWKPFIKTIIKRVLSIKTRPISLILWGNDAHDIVFDNITDKDFQKYRHSRNPIIIPDTQIMILQTSHPSPLSVNRGGDFLTTAPSHFEQCDKHLGVQKIHWTQLQ